MPISILNSGHGDSDPGAVANGLIERDINMVVAKIAKELMEFNGITVPPIISGSDLNEVIRKVNDIHAKTPVGMAHSLHHNAGKGDGSETIHSVNYGQATVFAKILQEEFDKIGQNRHGSGFVTKLNSSGSDYFGFIRSTNPSAIISEFAFIDSSDYKIIDTYEEQYAEGEAIAKAHCRFYGITFKSPKQTLTIQSTNNNNQGRDNVEFAVIGFSLKDLGACMLVAEKYGNCAIYFRNTDKTFNSDCLKANTLFVIGGSSVGHKNEKLLSGLTAKDTMQSVVNIL